MDAISNILVFALFIGTLVFFHELGHFAVAKWCGVKVHAFSLGFGPELIALRAKPATVSLCFRWVVMEMLGEQPGENEDPRKTTPVSGSEALVATHRSRRGRTDRQFSPRSCLSGALSVRRPLATQN